MKLLNVHIENFGKLSMFNYHFSDGLNTIYEENGFGKTTLATFIKVMLYGFSRTSSQNITVNERKKYDPWSGGKYGGYLEFEYQGIEYRVTRFFGKSLAKDTFSIFDLTHRTDKTCFTENLGEELFGLDVDSFSRSVYIPQNLDKGSYTTTSIHTKLSHLVEDTNDLNNYDLAIQKLKEKRTKLKKYKGNGGRISSLEEQLISLETKLSKIHDDKEYYDTYQHEQEELMHDLQEIQENLKASRKDIYRIPELEIQRNKFEELQNQINSAKQKLKTLDCRYQAGYPSDNELSELKKESSILSFNEYRLNEIKDLKCSSQYKEKMAKDIYNLQQMMDLSKQEAQLDLPSDKEMHTCLKMIQDYESKLSKHSHSKYQYCLILSLVLLIGILFFVYQKNVQFIIVFILLELFSMILYASLKKKTMNENDKSKEIMVKEKEQLLSFFEYYLPLSSHQSFKQDYEELKIKIERNTLNSHKNEEVKQEIQSILNDYQIKDLDELQQKYHAYIMNEEEIQKRTDQNQNIRAYIESFKQKYHIDDEGNVYELVIKDIELRESLVEQINEWNKQKDEYLKSYPDIESSTLNVETCNNYENELEEKRLQFNEQLNHLKYKSDECVKNIQQEKDLLAEYNKLLNEKNEYENKCILLDKTMAYLSQAKENLASLYIRKIEKSFMDYVNQIFHHELDDTKIDTSLNIYIEENGDLKKVNHYSTGMIGCIDLCMRLALVDALFEKEQPFIVLDDSFVDLDDIHLQKALDLIGKIAENRQIIYFVCHSSRC